MSAVAPASTSVNPLRQGLRQERMPEPCIMVICGATGDLTRRKLAPAVYNLALAGFLPPEFTVVGFARRPMTNEEFHAHLREGIDEFSRNRPASETVWSAFTAGIEYVQGNLDDPEAYAALARRLERIDRDRGTAGNRIFYLAIQPSLVPEVVSHLGSAGLAGSAARTSGRQGWTRLVVEKPFGFNEASAETLNREISEVFSEDQVFRIDHYLGKETVQNLAVFRFGNGLFEPIWNRRYIDSVQITVAETVGLEGRGEFYDETGALRDIVQNHVLQLLAVFAMEPPVEFAPNDLRDEKLKVLRAVRPMTAEDIAQQHGPRPVRRRLGGGREGPGLSRRAGGGPGFRDGDLRRHQAGHRLVAMGRRAVLHPHRQGAGVAGDGDRGPVPPRAARAVRAGRRAGDRPQRARHPGPARRGDPHPLRRQGARARA